MSKSMKELYQEAIERHERRYPGCKRNEKLCKYSLSDKCINKGDVSKFMKNRSMCKECEIERLRKYYEEVLGPKRALAREKLKKKKRGVSFKKGTKRA